MTVATINTKIWLALKSRVVTMAGDLGLVVHFDNPQTDPPFSGGLPDDYLIVSNLPNVNQRLYMGSNDASRRIGILSITLMTGVNNGDIDVDTQTTGLIASYFPADLAMRFDGTGLVIDGVSPVMVDDFANNIYFNSTTAPVSGLTVDGVTVKVTKEPDVVSGFRDGAYWRTVVNVDWQVLG